LVQLVIQVYGTISILLLESLLTVLLEKVQELKIVMVHLQVLDKAHGILL